MNFSRSWPWWAIIVFWVVIILICAGCARIIVQIGSSHEVDSTVDLSPKSGIKVEIEKDKEKPK